MPKDWIQILIPTYEYPDGVKRILDNLNLNYQIGIGIYISDDSISDSVQNTVLNHCLYKNGYIKFYKSPTPKGAVENWNFLLSLAKQNNNTEYIQLLHQDDCPDSCFYNNLKTLIESNKLINGFISSPYVSVYNNQYFAPLIPFFIKKFILNIFPNFILKHNIIGSPSNLIIKLHKVQFFSKDLLWFVDVDWFNRLNVNRDAFIYSKKLILYSFINPKSITNIIRADLNSLINYERKLLCLNFNIIQIIIDFLWILFKIFLIPFRIISIRKIKK